MNLYLAVCARVVARRNLLGVVSRKLSRLYVTSGTVPSQELDRPLLRYPQTDVPVVPEETAFPQERAQRRRQLHICLNRGVEA